MPFIGLIITSAAYVIPVIFAIKRKVFHVGRTCAALTTTSLLYHGTQHPVCLKIDEIVAHTAGICYSIISVKNVLTKKRIIDVAIAACALGSGWMFFFKSKPCTVEHISRYWHMGVHGLSNVGWTIYVFS